MNNFEKTKQLFELIGIEFEHFKNDGNDFGNKGKGNCIKIESGEGYMGFYFSMYFDDNGKFINHGCWE